MTAKPQERTTGRRLLVINPNTNPEVTRRALSAAQAFANSDVHVDAVNPGLGPFAIETPDDRAAAVPEVLSIIRSRSYYDGYVLACFDDIAIQDARRLVPAPVISMAEAGIRKAAALLNRFAVVTTVDAAVPTIQALTDSYGMAGRHSVLATRIGVAETAIRSDRAEAALSQTILRAQRQFHAEGILLGSGAYAGRSLELERRFGLPFIDGLQAAIEYSTHAGRRQERHSPGS